MLSNKIKESRKEMKLTQEQFAKKLGISRSNLSDLESGKNKGNNLDLLIRLSNLTNKSINYFVDDNLNLGIYEVFDKMIEDLHKNKKVSKDGSIEDKQIKDIVDDIVKYTIALKVERLEGNK